VPHSSASFHTCTVVDFLWCCHSRHDLLQTFLHALVEQNGIVMAKDGDGYHHFFLFRHCLRATASSFDASVSDVDDGRVAMPVAPQWDVPAMWCTETGLNITQAVGRYLMENQLLLDDLDYASGAGGTRTTRDRNDLHVQIIADAGVRRDVDTAQALVEGMLDVTNLTTNTLTITGLDDLYAEERLFDEPVSSEEYYTEDEQHEAILDRISLLPPPPDFPLHEAVETVINLLPGGNPLHFNITEDVAISKSNHRLTGAVDFVKTFAEMLMYSKASNLAFAISNNVTTNTIYQLLQYVHWSRSVANVNTPKSACEGAVHAVSLLSALRDGSYYDDAKERSDPKHRATILVGHDGDLDALATVLDARWILRAPYKSGPDGAYRPTPPLSALHAAYNTRTGAITLALLYPVYSSSNKVDNDDEPWVTNETGVLESAAILGTPFSVNDDGTATLVPSLAALEHHLLNTLTQFHGAERCYQTALNFHANHTYDHGNAEGLLLDQNLIPLTPVLRLCLGLVLGISLTMTLVSWRWHWRQQKYKYGDVYVVGDPEVEAGPPNHSDLELTLMKPPSFSPRTRSCGRRPSLEVAESGLQRL